MNPPWSSNYWNVDAFLSTVCLLNLYPTKPVVLQLPWKQKWSFHPHPPPQKKPQKFFFIFSRSFSDLMKTCPETNSVPEKLKENPACCTAAPGPSSLRLGSRCKQQCRKCWAATLLTLATAATVGGWRRIVGVREEEVAHWPSGTKWVIQLYSAKTPTSAGRQWSLYNSSCHQQHNKLHHLLE